MRELFTLIVLMASAAGTDAEADEDEAAARAPGAAAPTPRLAPVTSALAPAFAPAFAPAGVDPAPPVEELCRAAVAMAMAEPERARSFVNRARLAGWLPQVQFHVLRRLARTQGLSYDAGMVEPIDVDAINDVRYEWRATWDLSRILFDSDELQAHFEALRMADVRREVQTLVIRLYFERRRLWAEGPSGTGGAGARADAAARRQLRVLEIEAQLDALSGGAFSRRP